MIAGHLGTGPGTVAKHVSDACADLNKALPSWPSPMTRAGTPLAGEEAPAAPASDCISITLGTVPHRFGTPLADQASAHSPMAEDGVIG